MAVVSTPRPLAPSSDVPRPARVPKPFAEQVLTAAIVFGPLVAVVVAASALVTSGPSTGSSPSSPLHRSLPPSRSDGC